jgi:uncharacterized Rmd1/YagE family protein
MKGKPAFHRALPRRYDEAIYTVYNLNTSVEIPQIHGSEPNILANPSYPPYSPNLLDLKIGVEGNFILDSFPNSEWAPRIAPVGEIVYFDYGVVVMWGYTEAQEKAILLELKQFEIEPFDQESIETEQFCFNYNSNFQPRIFNDIITLKDPANHMMKLTISHAIAQSVKLTLFEGLIEETIENTRSIPSKMAQNGKIHMSRVAINKKIGEVYPYLT